MTEPAPRVTFEEFGDSSLNFVVRCFLPDMENRQTVIHDLHTAIDQRIPRGGHRDCLPAAGCPHPVGCPLANNPAGGA